MGALCLFVGLFLFIKKDIFKLFILHLFMSLAIPYNDYIYYILGVQLSGIKVNNILMLLILILIFKQLYAKRFNIRVSKIDILMIFFFMVVCLYFFVGYYNKNPYLWFDMKAFVFFFLNYIIFRSVVNNENYIKVINVIFISSLFYSVVVIYIYLFMKDYLPFIYGDKLFLWWGNRVTFSNVSMCLITIPLSIYCLLQNNYSNIKKFYFFLVFSLNLIAVLLSQTRIVIMMSTFNSIIVLVMSIYYSIFNFKKINIKKAYRIVIFIVFIWISLSIFYFLDIISGAEILNNVINRFSEGQETLNVRDVSNEMAKEEIIRNIWGYGLGKEAILYNTNYSINNVGPFIDNILFTLGLKIGLLGMLMFLILLLVLFRKLLLYRSSLVIAIYISFVLMTAIFNAQIIYSVPIVLIFILFICISKINREKLLKNLGNTA
ncbi:hypothetical protein [Geobacillus stearothermophilus]|uniref:hypothetical protein n=1 Tax=Geobacillus stearothermophilus TaxID=1422 RepID=UPI003D2367F6